MTIILCMTTRAANADNDTDEDDGTGYGTKQLRVRVPEQHKRNGVNVGSPPAMDSSSMSPVMRALRRGKSSLMNLVERGDRIFIAAEVDRDEIRRRPSGGTSHGTSSPSSEGNLGRTMSASSVDVPNYDENQFIIPDDNNQGGL